ncbi:hypothetical protein MMC09_006900 [Bachmanniomyces sp. S44760]|nr:hypothetical protein [Bachmanniomyces sp. S44760]
MAQSVPKSAPKSRLMQVLGMTPGEQADEQLYIALKTTCNAGYDSICADRRNLKAEYSQVLDRFTYNQMKTSAIDNAIVQTYRDAPAVIRQWFSHWRVDGTANNWIIRWFLYHTFRNRDNRNETKARSTDFRADDDDGDGGKGEFFLRLS